MRLVKLGVLLAAIVGVLGPTTAWACDVFGTVVCEGTDQPVEGVVLTFVEGATSRDASATDASGDFTVPLWGATWGVYLGQTYLKDVVVWDIGGADWILADPIEVPASLVPACAPPPPPVCENAPTEGTFQTEDGRPLGNPSAECAYFGPGSVPVGEGFTGSLEAPLASMDAAFAVVKSGRNYYGITVDVQEGDALNVPNVKYAVSHVTYCSCPTEQAASRAALSTATEPSGGCSSGGAGGLALLGLGALLPRLRRRRA